MSEAQAMDDLHAKAADLRERWQAAAARGLWRAHRLRQELDAIEAVLNPPAVVVSVPKLAAIPFYEYDVARGARMAEPVINAPIDTPHPGRSPVPGPLPDPGPPTYDVRPGLRMKDPE